MLIENNYEVQRKVENYYITLISGETISLPHITQEDVNEDREDYISIDLRTVTYNHRLYTAFKNKELVKSIIKHSVNVNIDNQENIQRIFAYDNYFKIQSFITSCEINSTPTYNITFQSI